MPGKEGMTGGRMGAVKSRKQGWQEMEGQPEAAMMDEKSILLRGIEMCVCVCVL